MDNIRDFIVLHYITKRRDTEFWRDVAEIDIDPISKQFRNVVVKECPIADDFTPIQRKFYPNEYNFALVMNGLELFDNNKINPT